MFLLQRTHSHAAVAMVASQLGDKPTGRQSTGRQTNRATINWATHFGQLGDNAPELKGK